MLPNARISQLGCRNVTGGHLNLLAVAGFARERRVDQRQVGLPTCPRRPATTILDELRG
jgi:hypothetical protein